jgi:hypothetical protein
LQDEAQALFFGQGFGVELGAFELGQLGVVDLAAALRRAAEAGRYAERRAEHERAFASRLYLIELACQHEHHLLHRVVHVTLGDAQPPEKPPQYLEVLTDDTTEARLIAAAEREGGHRYGRGVTKAERPFEQSTQLNGSRPGF